MERTLGMAQEKMGSNAEKSFSRLIPGSRFDSRRRFVPGESDELDIWRYLVEMAPYRPGHNHDGQLAGSVSGDTGIPPLGTREIHLGFGVSHSRHFVPGGFQPVVAHRDYRSRSCLFVPILLVIRQEGNYSLCKNELFTCYNYPT